MPTYGGTPVLTEAQAKEVQKVVTAWLDEHGGYGAEARMYKPGHEGPMWVISLEGCGDWPSDICEALRDKWPDGVFAEPVTSWCLGLHPAYCRYCAEGADDQPCPYHPA